MQALPDPHPSETPRSSIYLTGAIAFTGLVAAALVGLAIWLARLNPGPDHRTVMWWAFGAFCCGALTGAAELLTRYRDEPVRAASGRAGVLYIVLNGFASLLAFIVLLRYPGKIFVGLTTDHFLTTIAAGFGAMAVFRSKLFTFKSADGNEYPIGPALVLDTVLKVIDAKIDRHRATERQARVFKAVIDVDFSKMADYIEATLTSFQNLSDDDRKGINSVTTQYRTSKLPDPLKSLGLGFAFLTIAGDENFDLVVSNIRAYAQLPGPNPPPNPPPNPVP